MYKIAGFFHPEGVYLNNRAYFQERLNAMGDSLKKAVALFLHLPFRNRAVGARNRKQPYLKSLWFRHCGRGFLRRTLQFQRASDRTETSGALLSILLR